VLQNRILVPLGGMLRFTRPHLLFLGVVAVISVIAFRHVSIEGGRQPLGRIETGELQEKRICCRVSRFPIGKAGGVR